VLPGVVVLGFQLYLLQRVFTRSYIPPDTAGHAIPYNPSHALGLLLFLVPSAPIDRFFKYSFPAMQFNYTSDLPVLFPLNINTITIPTHATLSLSSTMGGNNGSTRPQPSPAITTVPQALEFARDSPEGAQDPTVATILETALADIWRKVEAQPTSYVMTRDEFAVFNYFQDRFAGEQLATAARRRYWDHLQLQNGS
jgi:hypothetical protein